LGRVLLDLFGGMNDCHSRSRISAWDVKQWALELGDPELPHQLGARHHALADARWNAGSVDVPRELHPAGADRRSVGRKYPDALAAAL